MEFEHTSVLLEETIENLQIKPDGVYVDGTLGGGGHSYRIASALHEGGRLIGAGRDQRRLVPFSEGEAMWPGAKAWRMLEDGCGY